MRTKQKYITIYNDLAKKIKSDRLQVDDLLPSENELTEQYQTSRETIRKALNLLAQNGFIHKVRGKGSIVLDVRKYSFPLSGLVSLREIAGTSGEDWKTNVHELALMQPDKTVQQKLDIITDTDVWKVVRSREINGERIILDIDYLKQDKIPRLSKEICESSLYEYLEYDLGLKVSFAKKEITVEVVTDEDKAFLDLHGMTHVVVVKNFVYLDDVSLIQYTESRHRLDKFKFVDFVRREHANLD
ncbi:trehalose operon repressor [Virgibacillus salexigens]|uniref:trehalose operon repressor n=1 Tax=Virgibacillus salexigens TaxID=61016 RepID=UPI001909C3CF|nr:trehalose operon repressor [Virgibacillus salexigens]